MAEKVIEEEWIGYGILNAFGEFWIRKVFETKGDAELYMEVFWGDVKIPLDMLKHEVVKLKVTPYAQQKH